MIKLVTGSTGTTHVTAADDGALHAAIAGDGLVVFEAGTNFAATVVNSTLVRIGDGEGLIDGRHFRIRPGESQELSLSDGVAGYNRNDLIVLHYTNSGGIENITLEVLEGEYSEGTAVDPVYANGTSGILDGAAEHYAPLYRLSREGINPPTAEALFNSGAVPKLSAIADVVYPVGSIYMSVNATNPATLFGGTWERIKDSFLLSAGDTYAAGETGGEAEHKLTTDEMPSHTHYAYQYDGADTKSWAFLTQKRSNGADTQVATSSSSGKYVITTDNKSYSDWPYYTKEAGGSAAHNNMPPYLAVYMWQRTA